MAQPLAQVLPTQDATSNCGPVTDVLATLKQQYGELPYWWGDTEDDVTMLLTQRPDTKTWTLLAVHGGVACMLGSGGTAGARSS